MTQSGQNLSCFPRRTLRARPLRILASIATVITIALVAGAGDFVHADDYDIYIAAGQSNMDGRAFNSELVGALEVWKMPQPNAEIYYYSQGVSSPTWRALTPGFANGSLPPFGTRFGPELSFAAAMAANSGGRKVGIIKVSLGGSALATLWSPPSGFMYQALRDSIELAMQQLAARGDTGGIRGVIWHQGESDETTARTPVYEENLTQFVHAVRNDLLGNSTLPFIIGELAQERSSVLRVSQFNVSQNLEYVGFASSLGLQTVDAIHFDTPGVIELGNRFAAEMNRLTVPEPAASPLLLIASCCMPTRGVRRRAAYLARL